VNDKRKDAGRKRYGNRVQKIQSGTRKEGKRLEDQLHQVGKDKIVGESWCERCSHARKTNDSKGDQEFTDTGRGLGNGGSTRGKKNRTTLDTSVKRSRVVSVTRSGVMTVWSEVQKDWGLLKDEGSRRERGISVLVLLWAPSERLDYRVSASDEAENFNPRGRWMTKEGLSNEMGEGGCSSNA